MTNRKMQRKRKIDCPQMYLYLLKKKYGKIHNYVMCQYNATAIIPMSFGTPKLVLES